VYPSGGKNQKNQKKNWKKKLTRLPGPYWGKQEGYPFNISGIGWGEKGKYYYETGSNTYNQHKPLRTSKRLKDGQQTRRLRTRLG